ncbi:translational GTPase TypA [Candidatus Ishikawella capsulata]|uniref:Large ribosomal subunit assembly factor BipA n=1 Tax=Candidatus Ishikawaella capsulata Mpkobe TaxID=476281 RepID=C5WDS8_9ENTR|nr:translational GTPase TypA [Candidatus Ishikawaella capsulata]BAH83484.1 GTP-binding protein [Candidatus Ishikawaella capsulata Mpkobe]
MNKKLRNIAIVAHVDHGKTTLIDKLLQQSSTFNSISKISERVMDSHYLEKERGITILAKNTGIKWNNYRINIIDTPGHADFGSEVERVMSMVESVLLVVDATEGPMPQTYFVTKTAFTYGLKPIVVVNKIDRPEARPAWVLNQVFDLFLRLDATEEQLDFPIIYTSAIKGIAGNKETDMGKDMTALYQAIIDHVPYPQVILTAPLQMQISQLDYDNYLGIIGIGRVIQGRMRLNQQVNIIDSSGKSRSGKINKILTYLNLKRIEINQAEAGDIIAVTGLGPLNISDTICDIQIKNSLPPIRIEKPTVAMYFHVNTSPFSGKEGKYITSRQLFERLKKETINNIALQLEKTQDQNVYCISGRGELQLSILIENMRREGFELAVSRPKVLLREIHGCKQEPFEYVILDIEESYQGNIIQAMGERKGQLKTITTKNNHKSRLQLEYFVPTRGLIGFRTKFMQMTSGTGIMYSRFSHYDNLILGEIAKRKNGVMISNGQGKAIAFALFNLQERGRLFIDHGTSLYEGQIVGIHNRSNDLTVNCLTGKKLTNMRASGSDEATILVPPIKMTLEQAIEFIDDEELVEVTPVSIRIRKRYLSENERKCARKILIKQLN